MERKYRRRALSKRSVFADPFFVDSPSEKGGRSLSGRLCEYYREDETYRVCVTSFKDCRVWKGDLSSFPSLRVSL